MKENKLHLGAGAEIKEGWVNLDSRDLPGIDVVRDVLDGIPFDDDHNAHPLPVRFIIDIRDPFALFLIDQIGGFAN